HPVVLAAPQELHGHRAEARREHAVEARGRAAALEVPEHHRTRFLTRQLLELGGHAMPDAAEPLDVAAVRLPHERDLAALRHGALGDHDDAEAGTPLLPVLDPLRDTVDVV